MTAPNLHDLINKPGAGKAEKIMRKQGYWKLTPIEILYSVLDDQLSSKNNVLIDQAINALEIMEPKECN
jgi:hypothetical protein